MRCRSPGSIQIHELPFSYPCLIFFISVLSKRGLSSLRMNFDARYAQHQLVALSKKHWNMGAIGSLCVFAVTLLSYLLREKKHHIVINNIIFIAICFIAIYQLVNGVTWCLQQPNTAVREMQSFESSFLWTLWSVNQTKYLSNQWKYHSNGDAATSRFTRHDVMPPRASIIF